MQGWGVGAASLSAELPDRRDQGVRTGIMEEEMDSKNRPRRTSKTSQIRRMDLIKRRAPII